MLIENNIADAVDFFHMDALSSTVALNPTSAVKKNAPDHYFIVSRCSATVSNKFGNFAPPPSNVVSH
jgi:hypothetical protein